MKHNPQDSTIRNVQALNKRIARLEEKHKRLELAFKFYVAAQKKKEKRK